MHDRLGENGARCVRTEEAAKLLGLSPRTLEKYRCHGTGPIFRKLGGRVVYTIDDLETWADGAACQSTSDPRYVDARDAGRMKSPVRLAAASVPQR
ncbi:helix-turn-helix transcriptional regulator [Acidocella facilis]|uniref:helix-turn-helix transcriptional regulator n=1 Tax=Acidocella facilis TaxID=525 RepID=UPI001F468B13|nr:helix-turn-helix domain-containing protein [Acidocella facilis]